MFEIVQNCSKSLKIPEKLLKNTKILKVLKNQDSKKCEGQKNPRKNPFFLAQKSGL